MRIEPLGDSGWIVRELEIPAYEAAAWLNDHRVPGVEEAVASYDTLGIYGALDEAELNGWLTSIRPVKAEKRLEHQIPVCYEMGPDLADVAQGLGLDAEQVIALHGSGIYTCCAVGFCPGFPYLGYLPEPLQGIPRRESPRVRVEPGMVGIAGRQTGIYPLPRPGGWALIGRTPLTLVDVADGYFPIRAGDRVRFFPIDAQEFAARRGERL